jgi:hypothetical protein
MVDISKEPLKDTLRVTNRNPIARVLRDPKGVYRCRRVKITNKYTRKEKHQGRLKGDSGDLRVFVGKM